MEFKTSEFYVNWWEKISLIDNQLLTIIIKGKVQKKQFKKIIGGVPPLGLLKPPPLGFIDTY